MVTQSVKYIGNELQVFENAKNWKFYFGKFIKPLLGNKVAEIGAGIGGATSVLCDGTQEEWLCVEPDGDLINEINEKIANGKLPSNCKTFNGYSSELTEHFDSILYIDVIEHIKNDLAELKRASDLLNEGGCLIVLVPAHQFLFSAFDQEIGHYRRYNRRMLEAILPGELVIELSIYLDSAGYFASLMNKLFLRQSQPTLKQIQFWDRVMVPVSRVLDRLVRFKFGKSILLVARKTN